MAAFTHHVQHGTSSWWKMLNIITKLFLDCMEFSLEGIWIPLFIHSSVVGQSYEEETCSYQAALTLSLNAPVLCCPFFYLLQSFILSWTFSLVTLRKGSTLRWVTLHPTILHAWLPKLLDMFERLSRKVTDCVLPFENHRSPSPGGTFAQQNWCFKSADIFFSNTAKLLKMARKQWLN